MTKYPPPVRLAEVAWHSVEADWLVVGVPEFETMSRSLGELDATLGGVIGRLRAAGDLTGKAGERVPYYVPVGSEAARLLLLGLGKVDALDFGRLHDFAAGAARLLTTRPTNTIAAMLPFETPRLSLHEATHAIALGLAYGSVGPGLRKNEPSRYAPGSIVLLAPENAAREEIIEALERANAEAFGVALARELVNLPPNELTPVDFAERARAVASEVGLACEVWDEGRLQSERMNAILGVARGSENPPRMVILRHEPKPGEPILALVGKGVTFDSGGLSLKTGDQMADMKCDMAGAAAVFGAIRAIALLGLPVNVTAVMPLVENMPSGRALKLGDVLRARNGKTIEILNTDAEGRVILADALAYVAEQNVSGIVDLATLTGACMVALGTDVAGLMSNDEDWCRTVRNAADHCGEKVWPLPMHEHFEKALESKVADLKNAPSDRYGGAITAGKFLQQFVGGRPWAHLDIAGPAWVEREANHTDAGGTGFGVRTLVELAFATSGVYVG